MLRVFNVGQSDSFELIPPHGCTFGDSSILVDCGQGSINVFRKLSKDKAILVLSHAHKDHIGGLSHLFGEHSTKQIKELWIPYYSDEIAKIAKFILSLKGVSSIATYTKSEYDLKNTVSAYRFLQELLAAKGCKTIRGIGRGTRLCNHLSVLNPPIEPDSALGIKKGTSERYWNYQQETGYEKIKQWLVPEQFGQLQGTFITEGWDYSIPNLIKDEEITFDHRMQFIYGFFHKYESIIDKFVESGLPQDFERVANALKLSSNDISIVLDYDIDYFSCLLTGDVGKKQLAKSLSARLNRGVQIFKFPHHGSKSSLNKRVLEKLSPEIVIISHGNMRFGKQRDPHPNLKVIQTLDGMDLHTSYTNDVIKKGKIIKKKSTKHPHRYVEFVD